METREAIFHAPVPGFASCRTWRLIRVDGFGHPPYLTRYAGIASAAASRAHTRC